MPTFCMAVHRWGSGCPGAMLDPTISSRNSDGVDGRAPVAVSCGTGLQWRPDVVAKNDRLL